VPTKADQLITAIMLNPRSSDYGVRANHLLREFHRGFPVENLRPLLLSPDEEIVKTGVFIASELGSKAKPLLADVVGLLKHPNKAVRFDAIGSVLTCTTGKEPREIAAAVSLLDDTEGAVRWKAMDFLMRASEEHLRAALQYYDKTDPRSTHVEGLRFAIHEHSREPANVLAFINSENVLLRKYGVVVAARMASVNSGPLEAASTIEDEDIRVFARDMLESLKKQGEQGSVIGDS
jgi:hypothetical protein